MAEPSRRRGPVAEVVVLAAGGLGVVASGLPWYQGSFSVLGFGGSVEVNAWNAGAGAWVSILGLLAAAMVVLVAGATATRPAVGWCWPGVLGLSVVSVVCLIARWASWPGPRGDSEVYGGGYGAVEVHGSGLGGVMSASAGPGVGFYLGLLAAAVTAATSLHRVSADRARLRRADPDR